MNTASLRVLCCFAFIALAGMHRTFAQYSPAKVALHINNLTSEERDSLSNELRTHGDLRISFACVPAGILILEPVNSGRSAEQVRALAASALIARLPAARRSEVALTQAEAEALCAAARNH
jgi:hypothetical protein